MGVQRVAGPIGHAVQRQYHRQVLFGYRHGAVLSAVDDGNRRAPVTLAAYAPVAQAPGGFFLAQAVFFQRVGHGVDRLLVTHAAEAVGVDGNAARLVAIPFLPLVVVVFLAVHQNHLDHRDAVFARKNKVALVVRRHPHYGAIAITHEHVVADPELDLVPIQWMGHKQPGAHAFFFAHGQFGLGGPAGFAGHYEGGQLRVVARGVRRQWMLGRHRAERHAHDGVGARGEDVHATVANQFAGVVMDVVREGETHALGAADPVLLHQLDSFGPARQLGPRLVQQLLRVVGDLEVITRDFAFFDHRAGAPALAVNDLFVGQHGLVHRVPVHDLGLAVGDAFCQHFQKQPLVPFVVAGVAGGHLAAPVDRQPHGLHLLLHGGDVVVGPLGRWHLVLERGILGRQPECVPTHRHQDVVALHAQVPREHVVDGVVAHMAHVQLAAGVGQHRAGVELLLRRVLCHPVGVAGCPVGLGRFLYGEMVVFVLHGGGGRLKCRTRPILGGGYGLAGGLGSATKPIRLRPAFCAVPNNSTTRP